MACIETYQYCSVVGRRFGHGAIPFHGLPLDAWRKFERVPEKVW